MDRLLATRRPESGGTMGQMRDVIFAEIKTGEITQAQADAFEDIHDRLVEAGLMD